MALAAAGLLAIAVAACGSDSGNGDGGAAGGSGGKEFAGQELVVINYGGTFGQAWDKYVVKPFEQKYGVKVIEQEALTFDTLAKMRAQKNNPQIDVWMMADSGAVIAQKEGLTQPLDPKVVTNLDNLIDKARPAGDPYAEFLFTSTVLAYNKDKIKTPPTSWQDLWNPAYKGKVMLPDINGCCGNLFLLEMARANGGSIDDVDPGFKKIETLKPNVLTFWTSHDQAASLLTSGQAWIGVWSSDRAGTQALQGAPVGLAFPKEGVTLLGNAIGVTKGSKNAKLAQTYINFALDAQQQKQFDEDAVLIPTNANVQLSANVQKLLPEGDLVKNAYTPDWNKVAQYMPEWTKRWEREVTSK
jgi:putative spermidine/putrescine transport system substrate-binding protein